MTACTQEQFPQHPYSVFQSNTSPDTQSWAVFCRLYLAFSCLSASLRWTSNSTIFYYQYATCAPLRPVFPLPGTSFLSLQSSNALTPLRGITLQVHWISSWAHSMSFLFQSSISMHVSSPHPVAVVEILFIFSAHLFLNVYRRVCVFVYITKPHRYATT